MYRYLLFFGAIFLQLNNVQSAPVNKNTAPFPNRMITWSIMNNATTVSPDEVRSAFLYAFDQWSAVIPREFVLMPPKSATANIRISFESGDHGDGKPFSSGYGSKVYAHSDKTGVIHFNDDIVWYQYEEGRINTHQSNFVDITWFALYQTGIVLGMKESTDNISFTYPKYPGYKTDMNKNYRLPKLSGDDVVAIQKIYGKR